jgi:hypothetical protein
MLKGLVAAGVLVGLWLVWHALSGRDDRVLTVGSEPRAQPLTLDADAEARVVAFCGDCHAPPHPQSYAASDWHDRLEHGYEFYARSGRNDLDPPPMEMALAYYLAQAPERLEFPQPPEALRPMQVSFRRELFGHRPQDQVPPAIAALRWARLQQNDAPQLLTADMRSGDIFALPLRSKSRQRKILAKLTNPCHVEVCDLDEDGVWDLLVADLGSYVPLDHDLGRVVWLRGNGSTFETVVLASGLGRVADARPADFDADGDTDVLVAEFGMHQTGGIWLLERTGDAGGTPTFRPRELDVRPGTIHIPIVDLNGDERPDFLALVSQEHESVEAFVNHGDFRFQRRPLWTAPDLTFGSSGIEPCDFDDDGDLDVLYTNGDSFDNFHVHPSHGAQWLENLGDLCFAHHRLTDLTGAYRALPADMDLDGDLDIMLVAWLPNDVTPAYVRPETLPSIICLEQTSPGEFARHTFELGMPRYAALEVADFDDDGDMDFVVGSFFTSTEQATHELAIWWNQLRENEGTGTTE